MSERMIPLHIADQAVAAVEDELAKVKAERDQFKADLEKSDGVVWTLSVENAHLKYEVERLTYFGGCEAKRANFLSAKTQRLTKAGDAMLAEWKNTQAGHYSLDEAESVWNAAKGVQS